MGEGLELGEGLADVVDAGAGVGVSVGVGVGIAVKRVTLMLVVFAIVMPAGGS